MIKSKISKVSKFYPIEHHLRNKDEHIENLFDELKDKIMKLGENIDEHIRKYFISYLVGNRFTIIRIKKNSILINIYEIKNDPKNWLKDESVYEGNTWQKAFSISSPSDIPYAISLIKQSYDLIMNRNLYK
jgi:predicted transport protein